VIDSIDDRSNTAENHNATTSLNHGYLAVLYVAAIYFAFRELVQAVSLATLGLFSTWLSDATNWFDIVYIILILFWSICMEKQTLSLYSFRVGAALTVMVFWVNVLRKSLERKSSSSRFYNDALIPCIFGLTLRIQPLYLPPLLVFLKGIMVGFAVFVGGVVYVVKRLAAFFLALLIILLAFAQIFYTIFRMTGDPDDPDSGCYTTNSTVYIYHPWILEEVCGFEDSTCVHPEPGSCEPSNINPWCTFWTSFYKTYSMLLGEVDDDDFAGNTLATIFFCLYMFGVVIVLANVLIAIVTDSYSVIKNERAGE
jgi:Ion transport protein